MSHFLDRLNHFSLPKESFSGDHGVTTGEDRTWEDAYRNRWAHDKIVRSTHGVNCTGSCSWKIYVKGGIVTWETQQTDYPRTRWDMPNHEPRGCARGASYSWYLYSANRVKHPMVRGRLLKHWRAARLQHGPVEAWAAIQHDESQAARLPEGARPGRLRALQLGRGQRDHRRGQRLHRQAVRPGPRDRLLARFPAMSMVSYAAGSRYLQPDRRRVHELLRLVLRPAAGQPADLGRADRRARIGRLVQQQLHHRLGQQRAADAHARRALLHRGALQGREDGGGDARLLRSRQAGRHLDAPQAGHRCGRGDGDGPCGAEGVLLRHARPRTSTTTRAATPTCRCW